MPTASDTWCVGISGDEILGYADIPPYYEKWFVLQDGTFSTSAFSTVLGGLATGISGSDAIIYSQNDVSSPAVISSLDSTASGELGFIQNILYSQTYTTCALGIDGSTIVGVRGGLTLESQPVFTGFIYDVDSGGVNDLINPAIYPEGVVPTAVSGTRIVGYYTNFYAPYSQGAQSNVQAFLYDGVNWTTFSDPSAAAGTTTPAGIDGNLIVGNYLDTTGTAHGFTYNYASNTWATIDDPAGANTVIGGVSGTDLVGSFTGTDAESHGFYASLSGATAPSPTPTPTPTPTPSPTPNPYQFQSLDVPGGKSTVCVGVFGDNIAGTYFDSKNVEHGFVLTGTNKYVTLTYPAPEKSGTTNTVISGVYDRKVFGSYYFNTYSTSGPAAHPFIYDISQGSYTNLPALGTGLDFAGIHGDQVFAYNPRNGEPYGDESVVFDVANDTATDFSVPFVEGFKMIQSSSQIALGVSGSTYVGIYENETGATLGFLSSGTDYLPVEEPNSFNPGSQSSISPIPELGTQPASIDGLGNVVGNYWDASSVEHGFVYDTNNVWTTVDVPSATYTSAAAIYSGTLVGSYSGTDGNVHGFIATPVVSSSATEPAPVDTVTFTRADDTLELSGSISNGPATKLDKAALLQFFDQPDLAADSTRLYLDRTSGVVILGSTKLSSVKGKPAPLVIY
ncbi:MAG TPA: hypothetical protein VHY22_04715, partial [Chthoniobacteraceae bacterium]|nr:hypothetical protein [Chthoniobacteraceae bacterium]